MELQPEYPVVDGTYQMTKEWSIKLSEPHNRRIEDGSLDPMCAGLFDRAALVAPSCGARLCRHRRWDRFLGRSLAQRGHAARGGACRGGGLRIECSRCDSGIAETNRP